MIEFARKNAGVAAAVAAYAALGAGGVLAVQQVASPSHRVPVAAPPAVSPSSTPTSPTQASPTPAPSASTPPPSTGSPAPASTLVVAAQDTAGHSPANSGGSPTGGDSGTSGGGGTGQGSTPPTRTKCATGRVAAVTLPLGVLPCDTVRVGRAVTIGGTG